MRPTRLDDEDSEMATGTTHQVISTSTAMLAAVVLMSVLVPGNAQVFRVATATPIVAPPTPTATPIPPGAIRIDVVLVNRKKRMAGEDSVAWMPQFRAQGADQTRLKIAQNKKQFEPRIAVVSVGSTVDFPNYDRVFHNVFSLSAPMTFDLGLYRKGKSKSVQFDQPGLVQIYCNIHPHMTAYLMIVDSRRHGKANAKGSILLRNVAPGRRTVEGWNARGGMWDREVTVRPGQVSSVTVELDISSWREATHLNKHGKEYPPPDDDDFRY
jgi:plastocyanin